MADTPFRMNVPSHHEHATALGYLCFQYANLELHLRALFAELVPCSDEASRAIFDATGSSIATRCDMILKLSLISTVVAGMSDQIESVFTHIKSAIAPIRNRYVHGTWPTYFREGTGPFYVDDRIFIRKSQAYKPKELSKPLYKPVALDEIWDLTRQITLAQKDVLRFYGMHVVGRNEGWNESLPPLDLEADISNFQAQNRGAS